MIEEKRLGWKVNQEESRKDNIKKEKMKRFGGITNIYEAHSMITVLMRPTKTPELTPWTWLGRSVYRF